MGMFFLNLLHCPYPRVMPFNPISKNHSYMRFIMRQTFSKRHHDQRSVYKHSVCQMLRHSDRLRLLELHKAHPRRHRHRRITEEIKYGALNNKQVETIMWTNDPLFYCVFIIVFYGHLIRSDYSLPSTMTTGLKPCQQNSPHSITEPSDPLSVGAKHFRPVSGFPLIC